MTNGSLSTVISRWNFFFLSTSRWRH